MQALLGILICYQAGSLKDLGTVRTFNEVALGRQGEPIEGFIHLSPDRKHAFAQTPRWLTKGYYWSTDTPAEYRKFHVGLASSLKGEMLVWNWSAVPTKRKIVKHGAIAAVVHTDRVLVYVNVWNRADGHTYLAWLSPNLNTAAKPILVTRKRGAVAPVLRPDGKRIAVQEGEYWLIISERGKVLRQLPYRHLLAVSPSHSFACTDREEVDLSTGRRQVVVAERGRNAVPYYWGDRLVLNLDGRYQLWNRKAKKLEDLGPYIPFLGSDISGRHILLQTDKTPNKMRSQTMITLR